MLVDHFIFECKLSALKQVKIKHRAHEYGIYEVNFDLVLWEKNNGSVGAITFF